MARRPSPPRGRIHLRRLTFVLRLLLLAVARRTMHIASHANRRQRGYGSHQPCSTLPTTTAEHTINRTTETAAATSARRLRRSAGRALTCWNTHREMSCETMPRRPTKAGPSRSSTPSATAALPREPSGIASRSAMAHQLAPRPAASRFIRWDSGLPGVAGTGLLMSDEIV